jgi:hypothetical protein
LIRDSEAGNIRKHNSGFESQKGLEGRQKKWGDWVNKVKIQVNLENNVICMTRNKTTRHEIHQRAIYIREKKENKSFCHHHVMKQI